MGNMLPAKVGNALKTISMNMRGMKQKGGETFPKLKKMLDDTTNGAVKLTHVTKEGKEEFRSTYDVIRDLSQHWDEFNNMQKSIIGEKFAGKQNANVFFSLMLNAKKDLEAIKKTADDSFGSAEKEQEAYMNSLSAKINSLKENVKGMFLDLGDTDFLKNVIGGLDDVVGGVRSLIKVFGGLPTVIGLCTTAAMAFSTKTRESIKSNIPIIEELENRLKRLFKIDGISSKLKDEINIIAGTKETEGKIKKLQDSFEKGSISAKKYGKQILGLKTKLSALKIGLEATKVATIAFESVLTGGISLILSSVITKIMELADNAIHASEKLNEFNQDAKKTFDDDGKALENAQKKFAQIQELQNKIAETKDEKEKVDLQKQLNDLQIQMAEILPSTASGYDANNKAIATQNALIKEQLDLKEQSLSDKADETADKNKDSIQDTLKNYKKLKEEREKLELDNMKGKTYAGASYVADSWLGKFGIPTFETVHDKMKRIRKEMSDSFDSITAIQSAMQVKMNQGWSDEQITDKFGVSKKEIDDFIEGLNRTESASQNANTGLKTTDEVLRQMGVSAEDSKNKIKGLADAFNGFRNKKQIIKDTIEEFKKFGKISGDTASKIFSTGDTQLISQLADRKNFLKNMQKLYKETGQEEDRAFKKTIQDAVAMQNAITGNASKGSQDRKKIAQDETNVKAGTYQQDANNHGSAENVKTNNSDSNSQDRKSISADETNTKANHYVTDTNNHGGSESTKTSNSDTSSVNRKEISASETNTKAGHYKTDTGNQGNAEKSKNTNAKNNAKSIAEKNGKLVKTQGKQYGVDNENYRKALIAKLGWFGQFCYKIASKISELLMKTWNAINAAGNKIKEAFGMETTPNEVKINSTDNNISDNNYKPNDPDTVKTDLDKDDFTPLKDPVHYSDDIGGGHGKSGSKKAKTNKAKDGKGSHSKSEEHIDIKDIEDEIDRYKSLQDAINDVNNSIAEESELIEATQGIDKLNHMHKEIDLYKDKKKAIDNLINAKKGEARELEGILNRNGFNAKNGNISNYTERLEAIKRNVNAMANSNKAKEKAIEDYKKLKEQADRYFTLTSNELPNLRKDWLEVGKSIKETYKSMVDIMSKTEKTTGDIIKNQIEKIKKGLDDSTNKLKETVQEQKDILNKAFDEDDYQRQLKEKQDALNKLNVQINALKRDDSSDGQSRLQDLLKKQEDAEKELNNFIRTRQKDQANKIFDNELNKIDKSKEVKSKEMEEKYTPEKIAELSKGMIQKGFVEIEGHVISLRQAINDYYKDQGELFANSSLQMQEYNNELKMTKQLYSDLNSMYSTIGIDKDNIIKNSGVNVLPTTIVKNISSFAIPQGKPNVTIHSDLNIGTLQEANQMDVKKMLEDNNKMLIREITDQIIN